MKLISLKQPKNTYMFFLSSHIFSKFIIYFFLSEGKLQQLIIIYFELSFFLA